MGFRFHKRIKIVPGLWYNLSKRGGSFSVGGKGITWNSKRGTTFSAPGTGISYNVPNSRSSRAGSPSTASGGGCGCLVLILIGLGLAGLVGGGTSTSSTTTASAFASPTPYGTPIPPFVADRPPASIPTSFVHPHRHYHRRHETF